MKALSFTIPKSKKDAILLQEDLGDRFYEQFHQHEEIQLSWIKHGSGKLIVGDSVSPYEKDAIVVLGGNVPHVFKSDRSQVGPSHMLTIFFTEASFGPQFFETEELRRLRSFFTKAGSGFQLEGQHKAIEELFEQLFTVSKLDRFILFIQLLKQINNKKFELLSRFPSKKYSDNDGKRMSAVYEFTINNFKEEISLGTIAKEAAMTKNAFCKYFKKRTRKTYVEFLNELRIEEACRLLQQEHEMPIAQVAEASGFQNISNFNRTFKKSKQQTPRNYRQQFS